MSPSRSVFWAVILVVFASALLVEVAARFLLPDKSPEPVVPKHVGQFDERVGWSKVPLARGISSRTGQPIEYRINSKGLRDDETTYEKPESRFRIVLLGDSFTFGWGVPLDKHYSTLLEGYFHNVEVINMGIEAFGIDQALLYLRLEGFRYAPDLVLAFVPGYYEHRHMHTTRFGRGKPRFLLVNGELELMNSPVSKDHPLRSATTLSKIHYWFAKSRVYTILRNGLRDLLRNRDHLPSQHRQQDRENSKREDFVEEMNRLGEAIIFAMHEESRDHGAKFVLVTQVDQLHQAAMNRGLLSLDVSGPLANPALLLPHKLQHINESGNGILAWEIARFLHVNGVIPAENLGPAFR